MIRCTTKFAIVSVFLMMFSFYSAKAYDLLNLVPENSNFVFGINLSKLLKNSNIQKQLEESLEKQSPEQKKLFDEFVKKTGLNPFQHINDFVIFASGKLDQKEGKPEAGIIVAGQFDIAKITSGIKSDPSASAEVEVTKFGEFDCIKAKKEDEGTLVFLDSSTAVIGTDKTVSSVIETQKGKIKNVTSNESIGKLLKKVDLKSILWGVGFIPQALKDKAKENPQAAPLAAINAFFMSFNYDDNIEFSFTGEISDKKEIENVITTFNGFLAMIKMLAGQSQEVMEILNMIKITSLEDAVKITLSISKAKLDEIRKKTEDKNKNTPQN